LTFLSLSKSLDEPESFHVKDNLKRLKRANKSQRFHRTQNRYSNEIERVEKPDNQMIVVKEEQGGDWTRLDPVVEGGGFTRTSNPNNNNNSSSLTMLKEEQHQQPGLPTDPNVIANNNNNITILHSNHNGPSPVGQGHQHHSHHHHHHNNSNSGGGGGVGNLNGGSGGNNSTNICSGCGQRIFDRYYVLAVDRQWHNECLKCHRCGIVLSNQLTCFARDGLILCKDDYYR
jgi:hypothetical protein